MKRILVLLTFFSTGAVMGADINDQHLVSPPYGNTSALKVINLESKVRFQLDQGLFRSSFVKELYRPGKQPMTEIANKLGLRYVKQIVVDANMKNCRASKANGDIVFCSTPSQQAYPLKLTGVDKMGKVKVVNLFASRIHMEINQTTTHRAMNSFEGFQVLMALEIDDINGDRVASIHLLNHKLVNDVEPSPDH